MTKLRPGLGSYTANWGTNDDRVARLSSGAWTPLVSLRRMSDPARLGLAPGPVTEESTSNPKESILACTHLMGQRAARLSRPDDRVKTN